MLLRLGIVLLASGFAVACGEVVTDPSATTGGGGSGALGNGAGGADEGGTAGSGATVGSCSGIGATPCESDEYCATPPGRCDGPATCEPEPDGCFTDCTGVCGCDGVFYCNECEAQVAGVGVSDDRDCVPEDEQYRAYLWLGGLDHIVVMRQNLTDDTCVRIQADWPTAPGLYPDVVTPDQWGVNLIEAWAESDGCLDDTTVPPGVAVTSTEAHGTIEWEIEPGNNYPCELDVSVVAAFEDPPGGLEETENVGAEGLTVDGGCL